MCYLNQANKTLNTLTLNFIMIARLILREFTKILQKQIHKSLDFYYLCFQYSKCSLQYGVYSFAMIVFSFLNH
jgi:hypothetical protein